MKKRMLEDPVRLRDVPAAQDASGVGAADLFREAAHAPRLNDAELQLLVRRARALSRRPRWRRLRLAFSLTSLPVLLFGVTVGAATTAALGWRFSAPVPHTKKDVVAPTAPPPAMRTRPRLPPAALPLLSPEAHLQSADPPSASGGEAGALLPKAPRRPHPARVASPTQAPMPEAPAPPAEDPLSPSADEAPQWALPPSEEAQLLRQAVRALRVENRPAVALDTLQTFAARYPESNLAPEADWLAVEAHMRLAQQKDALALLDAMHARRPQLAAGPAVLRAELQAAHGRCAEALPTFTRFSHSGSLDLQERALYGGAVCLAKQGDGPSARAAYEAYSLRFPHGRFAASARKALAR